MPKFEDLIHTLNSKGPNAERAALALGSLIERARTRRPLGDDGGVRQELGDEIADLHLTDNDISHAVDVLMQYTGSGANVTPSAVWALGKSYEARVVPTLVAVLRSSANDVEKRAVALNALHGVITCGVSSELKNDAIDAIRFTATEGIGDVQKEAQDYLKHYYAVTGEAPT